MAECPPQSFSNFTSECIQALQAKVQQQGVSADAAASSDTSGRASHAGFEIIWNYDKPTQTLTVQCVSSPFFAPCKLINAEIQRMVSSCYPAAEDASQQA